MLYITSTEQTEEQDISQAIITA